MLENDERLHIRPLDGGLELLLTLSDFEHKLYTAHRHASIHWNIVQMFLYTACVETFIYELEFAVKKLRASM